MKALTVGVVADPGLSTKIVESLAEELPTAFAQRIGHQVEWKVEPHSAALPLNKDGNVDVWVHGADLKRDHGWDLVVCVTELTSRRGDRLLVSDIDRSERIALISLPALGSVRLRSRVEEAIVHVAGVMAEPDPDNVHPPRRPRVPSVNPTGEEFTIGVGTAHVTVELSRLRGRLRVLLGMVRVNRPWRLLPSLSSAIAAGVAAAAFGVFYSSIWTLADAMSGARLAVVSIVAVVAMMLWLMLYNNLWEKPRDLDQRRNAALYNGATVLTLTVGVASMYALLFAVVMLGSLIIIPPTFLESALSHPVGWSDYVGLALLASSLGTLAGALGSSFETDYAVRNATYGKREQERRARTNQ